MGGARFLGEIIRLNKNPALLRNQPSQKGGAGITAKRPRGRKAMIVGSYATGNMTRIQSTLNGNVTRSFHGAG